MDNSTLTKEKRLMSCLLSPQQYPVFVNFHPLCAQRLASMEVVVQRNVFNEKNTQV